MSDIHKKRRGKKKGGDPKSKEKENADGATGMEPDGVIESNWGQDVNSFEEMNLKEELLRGIHANGFKKPTTIQQRAIMPCIKGLDVITEAKPGTGKTTAALISILQRIDTNVQECQAIILATNKELALQIHRVIIALGNHMNTQTHSCIGGTDVLYDKHKIENGIHVVVGTLGRIYHMIKRDVLKPKFIRMFVIDEADKMLSGNCKDEIHEMFQTFNLDIQVILLCATIPSEVLDFSKLFMKDPIQISVKNEELALEGIKQFYVFVENEDRKLEALCDMLNIVENTKTVIFCDSRRKVNKLMEIMQKKDIKMSAVHDCIKQSTRDLMMRKFLTGSSRGLITTDVLNHTAAQNVSFVINYDLPSKKNFIRRIGNGRFGSRKCVAVNFVMEGDRKPLSNIEQFYNIKIPVIPVNDFIKGFSTDMVENEKEGDSKNREKENYDRNNGMKPKKVVESHWDQGVDNFDDMTLKEELVRGIYDHGFEKPTVIQQRAIIPCIKGLDVIVKAKSGKGKTATSLISILQRIDANVQECQALILAPTRESALQIQTVITGLGSFMNVQCHACIGGTDVHEDKHQLVSGVQVVVGTIGRVYDMIKRNYLYTKVIHMFVIDKADQMLEGFKDEIHDIFRRLNSDIQVILLCAAMPSEVLEVSRLFMRNPVRIQ